jgi:hypothetical protein
MLMSEKMRKDIMVAKFTTFGDWSYKSASLFAIGIMILFRSPFNTIEQAASTMITHL